MLLTASAPIWQLAGTVARDTLDMQAVAMTRGVSKAGGATDQCRDNLRAAWPLLREAGRSAAGLKLLGGAAKACAPLGGEGALPTWAQSPYFYMAEGNYPFPSTYITFSVSTGTPSPLPAWPMRMSQRARTPDYSRPQAGLLLTRAGLAVDRRGVRAGAQRGPGDTPERLGGGCQVQSQHGRSPRRGRLGQRHG